MMSRISMSRGGVCVSDSIRSFPHRLQVIRMNRVRRAGPMLGTPQRFPRAGSEIELVR
jgi:hypothetical protein